MQYEEKLVLTAAFLGFAIMTIHFSQLAITNVSMRKRLFYVCGLRFSGF